MKNSAEKIRMAGNSNVMVCERGTMFGYSKLLFIILFCLVEEKLAFVAFVSNYCLYTFWYLNEVMARCVWKPLPSRCVLKS